MLELYYQIAGARKKQVTIKTDRFTIGSGRSNDLVLKHRQIARRHAVIYLDGFAAKIEDLGSMSGTWVNRERIINYGPISEFDEINIGDVTLWLNAKLGGTLPQENTPMSAVAHATPRQVQTSAEIIPLHPADAPQPKDEQLLYWGRIIHDQLIQEMDLRRKDVNSMSDQQLRIETEALLDAILRRLQDDIPAGIDKRKLRINVLNEAVGLGPLEQFLDDDSITEIMVNNHDDIYLERSGRLEKSEFAFSSDHAVLSVIERIITPLGRRIDESSPMVDARLKDGSRVNAIIPPLALKGPSLTIRKFSKARLLFTDLMRFGSLNENMVEFLRICVVHRKNVIVSGGTGSGKTTLLNVLSNFIPDSERIITVEDAAELKLKQPNLVSLEARPPNLEGRGQITIRDLVKNTLRMRPDRIIVGECRSGEALDMLQAMNTGHDGSLTTAHANSPRDVLSRLEVMVLMAGMDLPVRAIREQVSSAVDIIVQQSRFPCGTRKITAITEVVGIESGTIQLQDILVFKQEGVDKQGKVRGYFTATGFIPSFYEQLVEIGMDVDLAIFKKDNSVKE